MTRQTTVDGFHRQYLDFHLQIVLIGFEKIMKKIKMHLKNQNKFFQHEKKYLLNVFRGKSCNEKSSVQCKQGLVGY